MIVDPNDPRITSLNYGKNRLTTDDLDQLISDVHIVSPDFRMRFLEYDELVRRHILYGRSGKEGLSPVLRAFQEELRVSLEARVKVSVRGRSSGVIEVPFYSEEDFDRVFRLLTGKEAEGIVS